MHNADRTGWNANTVGPVSMASEKGVSNAEERIRWYLGNLLLFLTPFCIPLLTARADRRKIRKGERMKRGILGYSDTDILLQYD